MSEPTRSALERDLRAALTRVGVLTAELERAAAREAQLVSTVQRLKSLNAELTQVVKTQAAVIAQQDQRLAEQDARITVLEGKLAALGGLGASTPPSKKVTTRTRPYPTRERTSRAPGGQDGHTGTTLLRREPDVTLTYEPQGACECSLPAQEGRKVATSTRQVVDVEVVVIATDHVQVTRECRCGRTHKGELPGEVPAAPVSYGTSVKALVVGLSAGGLIPAKAATALARDLFELPVAEATLITWLSQLRDGLAGFDVACVASLLQSSWVAADETSMDVSWPKGEGTTTSWYVHVAANQDVTRYHSGPHGTPEASPSGRRSSDSAAGGVVGRYEGSLVTDGWSAYDTLHQFGHQTCLAHLVRYARFYAEDFVPMRTAMVIPWEAIATLLEDSIRDRSDRTEELLALARAGLTALEGDTRAQARKPRAYLNRLVRKVDQVFHFTHHEGVPPTSNAAEQGVRLLKVKQKRSQSFRTHQGLVTHLAVAGYLDTARKQGVSAGAAIRRALEGDPVMPPVAAE